MQYFRDNQPNSNIGGPKRKPLAQGGNYKARNNKVLIIALTSYMISYSTFNQLVRLVTQAVDEHRSKIEVFKTKIWLYHNIWCNGSK